MVHYFLLEITPLLIYNENLCGNKYHALPWHTEIELLHFEISMICQPQCRLQSGITPPGNGRVSLKGKGQKR
jgi:hypothetical protein